MCDRCQSPDIFLRGKIGNYIFSNESFHQAPDKAA